ncbi:hypothetical protein BDF20DRAFT_909320 [Mycotypha africana]|uniref:uncharacterized protein n=1 Tax=Mycotypha africana TaxID=64632 RepID=UPI002300F89F|nr:uncharacterized protein BDF20DRAFT_909320 [Mycotypha africana]KAI8991550.1 hypothetical protein BDF20DRAFT_909320 [Mycotypha africana]
MYGSFGQPSQQQSYSIKLEQPQKKAVEEKPNDESMSYSYISHHSSPTNTTDSTSSTTSSAANHVDKATSNSYTIENHKNDNLNSLRLESIFFNSPTEDTSHHTDVSVTAANSFDVRYPTNTTNNNASSCAINPTFQSNNSLSFYRYNEDSNRLFSGFHLSSPQDIIASLANVPIFNEICNFNQQTDSSNTSNQQQQHEQLNPNLNTTTTIPSTASTSATTIPTGITHSNTITSLLSFINNTTAANGNATPTTFNSILTASPETTMATDNNHKNHNTATTPSSSSSFSSTTSSLPPLNTTPIVITPLLNTSSKNQTYLLATKKPLKGSPRPFRERAPWTPEEDNLLKLAVQLYGDKTEKWSKIAACVPGRTNKNCRKRWFHSLDPSLRKGTWTEEEDQLLREGVSKFPNQWSKIAELLPGRTDDQCAKRWRESLDPTIDRSEWTAAEDQLLMEKFEEYGSQWQKIAYFFDGRPGLHCRNRWRKLQRLMQVKKEKESNNNNNTMQPAKKRIALDRNNNNNNNNKIGSQGNNNDSLPFFNTLSTDTFRFLHAATGNNSNNNSTNIGSSNLTESFQQLTALLTQSQSSSQQPNPLFNSLSITQNISNNSSNTCADASLAATAAVSEKNHGEFGNLIKPYGCNVAECQAVFSSSHLLYSHIKQHQSLQGVEKPYRCAMLNCNKKYKNINGLQYHIKDAKGLKGHHGFFLFTTAVNNNNNSNDNNSSQSMHQFVNSKQYTSSSNKNDPTYSSNSKDNSENSNIKFENENHFAEEIEEDERPYRCKIDNCNKAYRTASGLKYHQVNGHNKNNHQKSTEAHTSQVLKQPSSSTLNQSQQQQQQQQQLPQIPFLKRERWVMESA